MATRTGEKNSKSFSSSLESAFFTCAVAILLAVLPNQQILAQDWTVDPFVELIATYTDNLFLDPDAIKTDDYIGQINPGLEIRKTGGRFTTDTYYRMQSLFFSEDSDFDTIFHQLSALATVEAIPERFFIDANATIDQSVVDPTQPIPISNVAATGNLGDVTIVNVNPYFIQRIGSSSAFLRADYINGIGRYDDFGQQTFSRVDDFNQDYYGFYLGSDEQETGFEWSLTYDKQDVDYEIITDYVYEQAGLSLAAPITRSFRLVALGGVESDLIVARDIGGLDSNYWQAGFRINAGRDKVLELRGGERFFGSTIFGNAEYVGRILSFSVSYTEEPTTSALDNLGIAAGDFTVNDGDPVLDDNIPIDDVFVIAPRAEVYVSKRLSGRIEFEGNRTLFSATYYDEKRDFIDLQEGLDDTEDRQTSIIATYVYEFGPRTDISLSANWIRYDFLDTDDESDVRQYVVSLLRRIGNDLEARLSVRYAEQESDTISGFGNYTENAIEIGLLKRF